MMQMRDVTIYGITSHQARPGSFVDMYKMPPLDSVFPIGGGEALMVEREMAQRLRLQVHTIRRSRRTGGVEETYIAIEPELEALLMLPLQVRLDEAERRAAGLRQRLQAFNALPWYRRVWAAIRRSA